MIVARIQKGACRTMAGNPEVFLEQHFTANLIVLSEGYLG